MNVEFFAWNLGRGLGAELVERADQFAGDLLRRGLLDHEALHQIDELAVAQDGDGRRGRRIALKIAARALRGFAILPGEDGDLVIGRILMYWTAPAELRGASCPRRIRRSSSPPKGLCRIVRGLHPRPRQCGFR